MKKNLLCIIYMLLFSVYSYGGGEVLVDGIRYSVGTRSWGPGRSYTKKIAKVIDGRNCTGKLILPEYVYYESFAYYVESIGASAFSGCSGLTSITFRCDITSIGSNAFYGCTGLTSITIGSSVTEIGTDAFKGCSGLESIVVSSYNMNYDSRDNCNAIIEKESNKLIAGCNNTVIPNGVTAIGSSVFYGCSGLTSITIPESVTSIGDYAFYKCSGLTSITIPNTVTKIGSSAFEGCSGLASIIVDEGNVNYDSRDNCNAIIETASNKLVTGCKKTTIPKGVTSIGSYAFWGCSGLTSITIPESVTSIGDYAFYKCSGLTSIIVEEGNANYDSRENCNAIIETASNKLIIGCKNTTIPNTVTSIGDYAFSGCSGLTSITIPNSVTSIGSSAFSSCTGLTSINIPESVTIIGLVPFEGCTGLTIIAFNYYSRINGLPNSCSLVVPSPIVDRYKDSGAKVIAFDRNSSTQTTITIGNNAPEYITLKSVQFGGTAQDVVNGKIVFKGLVPNKDYSITISGEASGIPFSYPITVKTKTITVDAPVLVKATNTTLTVTGGGYNAGDAKVSTGFSSSDYNSRDIKEYKGNEVTITGLAPGERRYIKFMVKTEDGSVFTSDSKTFTTQNITAGGRVTINSASSATLKGTLSGLIDATVKTIGFEENEYKKDEMKLTGLNPNTSYKKQFRVTFEEGGSASCDISFMTDALTLETQQPKVISEGNVIVAATSNLDDEEKNVGFEWRRQDWTDDFDSKTGGAYMYEGQMEGYIRSINANYLWKFRPYYEANNGSRYYGEWKGIDPADFSYFEPTVHTYSKVNVDGNTAQVSGYAQRGTDNITSQGFMYWRSSTKSSQSGQRKTPAIPSDAKTIEATGTVMEANLTDLEYESTYNYVAFIRTSEGETFYGETKTFQTGKDLTPVEEIPANDSTPRIVARYNIQGHRIGTMQRGINIIRMSDGTVRKVMVK